MVHVELLSLLGLTAMFLAETEARCSSTSEIECHRDSQCIAITSVCDSAKHCSDGSDEDPYVCETWTRTDRNCIGVGHIYCGWNCRSIPDACSIADCNHLLNPRMCEMVRAGKLNLPKKPPEGMNMTSGIVAVLTTAVNTSLKNQKRDCPMLYTRVGQFLPGPLLPGQGAVARSETVLPVHLWGLVKFDNLSDFEHLVLYMRNSRLTTDYWVGGRFDLDTNAWSWTVDESVMPLGTPYWAVRHSSSCVPRPPPHTDPFSSPSAALPDAPCLSYTQAPANRQEGWCSALTYEHYYYMTDQSCQEERSPLCMLEADDDDDQLDEEPEGKV
ncbi:uncharacterized protein [Procambarus clarkii]|uniref:uncharacterized protein n=1 Tax=Procambarus clarkii TaxID=6728 RepID=UPI0037431F5A